MSKSNVVVVGGGGAGIEIAKQLSLKLDPSKYQLILITDRPFSVWLPAVVRTVVTSEGNLESLESGSFTPYDRLFNNGHSTVKVGTVTAVEPEASKVVLESGERVPYAALVLATGMHWSDPINFPNTKPELDAYINEWRAKFRNANHVMLVGGGAVGIELAGEIKDRYPNKPVTIVQGSDALLNATYPKSYRTRVERAVKARGIDIITSDYVDTIPEGNVTSTGVVTRSGKHVDADLVVATRGAKPVTEFLTGSGLSLSQSGFVKAELTLQAKGFSNIFIAGDILDFDEQKQIAKYPAHANVIVSNLISVLEGKEAATKYKKQTEMVLITLGKRDGVAYIGILWGLQFGAWLARLTKAGDLFVARFRKGMGY